MVAAGTKTDLLAGAGTHVTTRHPAALSQALDAAGLIHHRTDTSPDTPDNRAAGAIARTDPTTIRVEGDAEMVGHVAWSAGVPLTELRAAEGTGLEEMFLTLTSDTQRDRPAATAQPSTQGAVA